ncbi:MAG: CofH family radical SAM protein [Lentisphaeria bacterium]|nr:CofH family radical SAM protein [Lentisphaeria bacterium]
MRLLDNIYAGERVSAADAVRLFELNLTELGAVADFRRRQAVPDERVGYIVDRIVNYSNRCVACCEFCAFHADAGMIAPYDLSFEEIIEKIGELVVGGGTQVMLQGGLHPDHPLDWYLDLLRCVKTSFPHIWLHSFSPAEIVHIAILEGMSHGEVIGRMKTAGLDSVPGASDLLVDSVRRRVSPRKCTRGQWREVMLALRDADMVSSATMTYGLDETLEERVEHLCFVRTVQDETGILQAFIPWSFSPANTRMCEVAPAGGVDYLKTVAVARIVLDNVDHIQAGWLTEGPELAQLALCMGANDMGGVLTEELVVQAAGIHTRLTAADMEDLIQNAGKIPMRRDSRYQELGHEG